jgi:hypothetical protein
MHDPDVQALIRAAAERQLAVDALQKKYAESEGIPTEKLVKDMQELLSTEWAVLDAIITLFVKIGSSEEDPNSHLNPLPTVTAQDGAALGVKGKDLPK